MEEGGKTHSPAMLSGIRGSSFLCVCIRFVFFYSDHILLVDIKEKTKL